MLEYSSVLNVGVEKGIINGFWSVSSVSEKSGGAIAPPVPMPVDTMYVHMYVLCKPAGN